VYKKAVAGMPVTASDLVPVTGVEPVRYRYHRILSFELRFTPNHFSSLRNHAISTFHEIRAMKDALIQHFQNTPQKPLRKKFLAENNPV
jgi:hypothetical protein